MRRGRWKAWVAGLPLLLGALWSLGFAVFLGAAREPGPSPRRSDGIVVLTGGADRIATGLRLLEEGRAPTLLISGARRGSGIDAIARSVGIDARGVEGQIALGYAARTTLGNAAETAAWAQRLDAHSLIIVTAGYHMPRALLEIGRALPGIELRPMPVQSPVLREAAGPAALRLLASEFDKWLAAWLGLRRIVYALSAMGRGGTA